MGKFVAPAGNPLILRMSGLSFMRRSLSISGSISFGMRVPKVWSRSSRVFKGFAPSSKLVSGAPQGSTCAQCALISLGLASSSSRSLVEATSEAHELVSHGS